MNRLDGLARALLVHRQKDDGIMALQSPKRGILVDFQPMSPDEIERTLQFLLNHQAQFAADLERLSIKTDRIAEGLIGLTGIVGQAFDRVAQVAEEERRRT